MTLTFKNIFRGALLASAVGLCIAGYESSKLAFVFYLILYSLGLAYHLIFDEVRSKLFVWVFSLFIISSAFGVYFSFSRVLKGETGALIYLNTVQLFWVMGFVLIFLKMLKEHPFKMKFNKWSWMIILILVLDFLFAKKIIAIVDDFGLSSMHILYSFAYTILKLVLFSIGLMYQIVNTSTRISTITAAFLFFFLSDITQVLNSLFFFGDPLYGITLLELGMFCIALFFFYMYCVMPDQHELLKKEALLKKRNQGGAR
ncbi:hypothetical protein POV27_13315 [Aureisphaera galaxeae]|uniref:hypothetical protein n=1 Tax=Aureisphaera galaxeae TaxID=1538023 RepID=UPI002350D6D1|nr:hypothetical protein [Aureisphaera galaxeae]MDC8005035.1 hypothetical protein [Aureisphaera galaxeae]